LFTVETVIASAFVFTLMLIAYKIPHKRAVHIPIMSTAIVFDLAMPFYLYLNRDWKERLIDGGEIFSFLIWMHLGLVLTLYALYFLQVKEGLRILKGKKRARESHRSQAKGILLTRFLVLFTGAILYEPEQGA